MFNSVATLKGIENVTYSCHRDSRKKRLDHNQEARNPSMKVFIGGSKLSLVCDQPLG